MSKDNGETELTLNYTPVDEIDNKNGWEPPRLMRVTLTDGTVIEFEAINARIVPPEELEEE